MKRLIIFLAVPFLSGCIKDTINEPNKEGMFSLNVTVEKGSDYVSKIDAVYMAVFDDPDDKYKDVSKIIAETAYGNGTFTLELPWEIEDKFLTSFEKTAVIDTKDIQISDRTAKMAIIPIYARKGEQNVGIIYRYSVDLSSIIGTNWEEIKEIFAAGIYSTVYMYANKPVTIKGVAALNVNEIPDFELYDSFIYNYNLILKAGWNKCTYKTVTTSAGQLNYEGIVEVSNDEPVGMKWYYLETGFEDENTLWMPY